MEPSVIRKVRTPKFGAALPPDQMIQKYVRDDHAHRDIPFLTEEDDFPRWPLCLGVVIVAVGIGWLVGVAAALVW